MLSNVIAKTVAVTQNPVAREIVLDWIYGMYRNIK
jgi:hypothetical protein